MKQLISAVAVIVIIVIAWIAFGGKNDNGTSNNQQTGNTDQQANHSQDSSNSAQSSAKPASTNQVTINNFAFGPADITVKKGTKVTWTNQDSTSHTVTETDGKTGPDSKTLSNGQSYSFTYNNTGSFSYHCSIHPEMTGTVTVTD